MRNLTKENGIGIGRGGVYYSRPVRRLREF